MMDNELNLLFVAYDTILGQIWDSLVELDGVVELIREGHKGVSPLIQFPAAAAPRRARGRHTSFRATPRRGGRAISS